MLKSCAVCVVPVVSAGVVSGVVVVEPEDPLPLDAVVSVVAPDPDEPDPELEPVLVVVVPFDGDRKLMPLEEPLLELPAVRLSLVTAMVPPPPAAPFDPNTPVADGLLPEVTLKSTGPLLDSSQGALFAGAPPFKLTPMTYRLRSVVSTAQLPLGRPGVPAG